MKKAILLSLLICILAGSSCVRASKHCKSEHKRAKKNGIGWKY